MFQFRYTWAPNWRSWLNEAPLNGPNGSLASVRMNGQYQTGTPSTSVVRSVASMISGFASISSPVCRRRNGMPKMFRRIVVGSRYNSTRSIRMANPGSDGSRLALIRASSAENSVALSWRISGEVTWAVFTYPVRVYSMSALVGDRLVVGHVVVHPVGADDAVVERLPGRPDVLVDAHPDDHVPGQVHLGAGGLAPLRAGQVVDRRAAPRLLPPDDDLVGFHLQRPDLPGVEPGGQTLTPPVTTQAFSDLEPVATGMMFIGRLVRGESQNRRFSTAGTGRTVRSVTVGASFGSATPGVTGAAGSGWRATAGRMRESPGGGGRSRDVAAAERPGRGPAGGAGPLVQARVGHRLLMHLGPAAGRTPGW